MAQSGSLEELGEYKEAGARALELALQAAGESARSGRIPIAGSAVLRNPDGTLTTVAVGVNGRIPADGSAGYPTDHGETGCLRNIEVLGDWDWTRIVFATTLAPCVMCARSLKHLNEAWVANKRFEISKFKLKIPRARTSELHGSFSAVSKPNFASKYSLESSRRDLHNALLCTVL